MRTSHQSANAYRIGIINRILVDLRSANNPASAALLSDDVGECTFSVSDLQYHRGYQANRIAKGETHLKSLNADAVIVARDIGRVNLQISREGGHATKAMIGHRDVLLSDLRAIDRDRDDDKAELAAIAKLIALLDAEVTYRANRATTVASPVVSVIRAETPSARTSNRQLAAMRKTTLKTPKDSVVLFQSGGDGEYTDEEKIAELLAA